MARAGYCELCTATADVARLHNARNRRPAPEDPAGNHNQSDPPATATAFAGFVA
jgi:hypothetical protein